MRFISFLISVWIYRNTAAPASLSLSATRCVRRLLKACAPGHAMPRQRVSTSQTPEYHNPSPWTVDLSIRSHIQRIGWVYSMSQLISLTSHSPVGFDDASWRHSKSLGWRWRAGQTSHGFGVNFVLSSKWRSSTGRFSQIWLKDKYESKKP
jgi:hypothetical protein